MAGRESQLVLGLDPDPERLWPTGVRGPAAGGGSPSSRAAAAVADHCRAAIDAAGRHCVAVKPQLACFERLGADGRGALQRAAEHAREAGLLVIADAKRGDVSFSASAYADALLGGLATAHGRIAGLGADAFTASPYLGRDALEGFTRPAAAVGAGVFVLVRTSNPGAADLQDLELAAGGALWEATARIVDALGTPAPRSGLADVGAVVGATAPQHLERARELMPAAVFLLPGIGAQGGRVAALTPAFAPGRAGGLVTASRAIVDAHVGGAGAPAAAARDAAERLRADAWALT